MNWITPDDLLRNIGRTFDQQTVTSTPPTLYVAEAEIVLPDSNQVTTWHSPYAWVKTPDSHMMPGAIEETMSSLLPEGTLIVFGPVESNRACFNFVNEESNQIQIVEPWDENPMSGRYWCVMAKHLPTGKFVATVRYDTMEGQYKPIHEKLIRELFFKDFPEYKSNDYENLRVVNYALCKLLNAPIIG